MEKAIEKLQQNPYYEKYADRIAQLQRTSPEEFMNRVESAHRSAKAEHRAKFAPSPDTRYWRQWPGYVYMYIFVLFVILFRNYSSIMG